MTKSDERREEQTAARDFTMARLAACRGALALAGAALDECLSLFVDPAEDPKGKDRAELLEAVDGHIGEAARGIQLAQVGWDDIDPKEGEPDPEEDDDGDEDEEEDEDGEDAEAE